MRYPYSLLLAFAALTLHAQVPERCPDIYLQGFYWDSQQVTGWKQLQSQVDTLSKYFDGIWLPPSAQGSSDYVGGNDVGYFPRIWNNQNSCWGTAADLKRLIQDFHNHGTRVMADIVVNHRAGYSRWCNFSPDNFGVWGNYQLTPSEVCRTDEYNRDAGAKADREKYGEATGQNDTGEDFNGARDLDHTSPTVQNDIKAYLNYLKHDIGYDAWRYDFVKGFAGSYIDMYNTSSTPYISVGEYWDGSYDNVDAWLNATHNKSMAFDFPMKYAALNGGLAVGNYDNMVWKDQSNKQPSPAGLAHYNGRRRYAMTFIDNHDTYRDHNRYAGDILKAYAFLFSSPGVPMVFYPHWAESHTNRWYIGQMIKARRVAGIHSESASVVWHHEQSNPNYYEAHVYDTKTASGDKSPMIACIINYQGDLPTFDGYFKAIGQKGKWGIFLRNDLKSKFEGIYAYGKKGHRILVSYEKGVMQIPEEVTAINLTHVKHLESVQLNQNPNLLVYVAADAQLPSSWQQRNIIKGQVASTIRLVQSHDFYVPTSFKAQEAIYVQSITEQPASSNYWNTLYLPFAVNKVVDSQNQTAYTFDQMATENPFMAIRKCTEVSASGITYEAAQQMLAYTPYLFSLNADAKHPNSGSEKTLLFMGENVTFKSSEIPLTRRGGYTLTAATQQLTTENEAYVVAENGKEWVRQEKGTLKPFTWTVTVDPISVKTAPSTMAMPQKSIVEGIDTVMNEKKRTNLYNVEGKRLSTMKDYKGIVIRDGKKWYNR